MGISERKERKRRDLRKAILEAAGELFVREGIENVSMRKIAEKIEYSPTTIYLYFKDKADLIAALVRGYFEEFLARVESATADLPKEPLEALKASMRAYIDFGIANPFAYRLAFMMENHVQEGDDSGLRAFEQLLGLVKACIERGIFRDEDPSLVAGVIWSMNHGIVSLAITRAAFPGADRDAVVGASVEAAVNAFLRHGP
jgi:AcrR family transcriptional regulator